MTGCPSLEPKSKYFSRDKTFINFDLKLNMERDAQKDQKRWKCHFRDGLNPVVQTEAQLVDESNVVCTAPWSGSVYGSKIFYFIKLSTRRNCLPDEIVYQTK